MENLASFLRSAKMQKGIPDIAAGNSFVVLRRSMKKLNVLC